MRQVIALLLLISCQALAVEHRVKVAVVDTGIRSSFPKEALCEDAPENTSGSKSIEDVEGHGTTMSCIIMDGIDYKKACIWPIKYIDMMFGSETAYLNAFRIVLASDAKIVNFSSTGYHYSAEEHRLIKEMLKHGITVVVAAGNESQDLDKECHAFPTCLIRDPEIAASGNFHTVGALTAEGEYASYSNHGVILTDNVVLKKIKGCEFVQGSSPATAMVTNHLLKRQGLGRGKGKHK